MHTGPIFRSEASLKVKKNFWKLYDDIWQNYGRKKAGSPLITSKYKGNDPIFLESGTTVNFWSVYALWNLKNSLKWEILGR